jgi:hypothetical protein
MAGSGRITPTSTLTGLFAEKLGRIWTLIVSPGEPCRQSQWCKGQIRVIKNDSVGRDTVDICSNKKKYW